MENGRKTYSSADNDMWSDESDWEDEMYHNLLKACNKAFTNGVTSADIYDTLKLMEAKSLKIKNTGSSGNFLGKIRQFLRATMLTCVTMVALFWFMLHFFDITMWPLTELNESRCLLRSHPLIMQIMRPESNCSFCQDYENSGSPIIEFQSSPTPEEFESLAYSSKPIIIRGIGTTNFSFKKLKKLFDSEPDAMVVDHCQFLPFKSSFTNLKEVFDTVLKNRNSNSSWYIGWSNCHPGMQEKLRKIFHRPAFLPKESVHSSIDWIFIGSVGYGAPMHLDFVKRPSWQAQLSSEKTWRLKPPPECEGLCADEISFKIGAGDMIFLDTNSWFHETIVSGARISISIGSEYD